jgi:hypothetical protein
VFRAREEEGEFHTLFGRLKDFRMSFSKFEKFNFCCSQTLKRRKHDGSGA